MEYLLVFIHILVCLFLILVVLLQSGKAADLAGAFGGGGSQTALGSRGAVTLLAKATTISAILFMLTSLGLALYGSRGGGSVLDSAPVAAPTAPPSPAPAEGNAPAGGAAAPAAAPEGQAPAGQAPEGGTPGSAPAQGDKH